ncbi:efflux RND transporter periplasmic adaptor subunit [Candidatus Latescibacterota bacterium]
METWRTALAVLSVVAISMGGCGYFGGAEGDGAEDTDAAADSTAADSTSADSASVDTAVIGSADADSAAADSAAKAVEAVPVETAAALVDDISSFLLFSSTIETEAAVEVHPQVAGLVREVRTEEGDKVREGDTLVVLDDDQAQIDAQESEINLRHQETNFERTEEMNRRRLISAQEYENSLYQLEQARLRHRKAQLALEHTVITAPFSGVLTNRYVQEGGRVSPGAKLYDLVKLDDMIARVFVPGRYLTVIRPRQQAVVVSDFLPDMEFAGYVRRISPVVDPQSGTFKVTVGLEDRWQHLRPGIFVNVQIVTDTHEGAILIPKEAVIYDGGDRFVFIVVDSTATKVRLEAGYDNSRYVEVLSQIDAGTPVIVVGQNGLKDQARVKVVNAESFPDTATDTDQG